MHRLDLAQSRHPFEVFLLAACLVAGLNGLLNGPAPNTITYALDPLTRWVWLLFLTIGGGMGLAGPWLHGSLIRTITGLQIEALGLLAAGGAALVYSSAVILEVGRPGAYPAFITGAFAFACFWRAAQIRSRLVAVRATLRDAPRWEDTS